MFVPNGSEPNRKKKMTDSLKTVNTRKVSSTPQSQKAVKGQKKNAAGGFVFTISDMDRAKRFLILGSESNFYTPGQKLSAENAKVLVKLASASTESSRELVDEIVAVSTAGRAPKQNPGLFALAIAASNGTDEARAYALAQLSAVARTGTSLFLFLGYIEQFRGWGRALRRTVSEWYTTKGADKAAYQAVKYQSREGFTHRDAFRLSHLVTDDAAFKGLGEWILRGDDTNAPKIVKGFVAAHAAGADIPAIVREYGLSWEMLPTENLNKVEVWDALLDGNVPLGALIRQLPRLTRIGVVGSMSPRTKDIAARLTDKDEIERARIHPLSVLTAMKTYASGKSVKGSSTWTPVPAISKALDSAFYLAFKNVEPANKRTLIGLDVSGSMGWGAYSEDANLTPREITAAMSLVISSTEPMTHVIGFTGGTAPRSYRSSTAAPSSYAATVTDLSNVVTAGRRLDDVVKDVSNLPMAGTDCALPMLYAMEQGLEVDTFVVMTDNETWAGSVHPFQALKQYRAKTGIPAKLVVFSTEATKFSIADPDDDGMLDIAGFDSSAPSLLADFSRGL